MILNDFVSNVFGSLIWKQFSFRLQVCGFQQTKYPAYSLFSPSLLVRRCIVSEHLRLGMVTFLRFSGIRFILFIVQGGGNYSIQEFFIPGCFRFILGHVYGILFWRFDNSFPVFPLTKVSTYYSFIS